MLQLGWLFGSTLASFSIQNTKVVAFKYANQTFYDCANWVNVAEQDMQVYVTLSFVLTFVLPIIFLTISYGAIGRRLMRTQKYWCSYKQTVPFSQNSATKIPSNNQQEQLQESEHNQSGQQKSTINSHSMNDSINNFGPFNYRSIGSINNCQTLIQSKPRKPSSSLSLSSSSSQSASTASKTATYSPSSIVASKSVESCPITYNDSHCYKHNHHHPEENRNQRENFLKEKSFTKLRINRSFYLGRLHRNKSVSNKNPTILFRNYNPKTILAKSIESRSEIKISSANNSINNNSVNLASNDGSFNSIGLSGGVVLGEGGGGSGIGTSRFNRFHSRSKNNHPYTIILKFDKRNTEFLNKMRVCITEEWKSYYRIRFRLFSMNSDCIFSSGFPSACRCSCSVYNLLVTYQNIYAYFGVLAIDRISRFDHQLLHLLYLILSLSLAFDGEQFCQSDTLLFSQQKLSSSFLFSIQITDCSIILKENPKLFFSIFIECVF